MAYHDDDEFRLGRTIGGRVQDGGRRFAILRCAKIKNLGNMGASLQHTFRERDTPNADPARLNDNTVLLGAEDSRGVLDAWHARAPDKIRANAVHGLEYFIGGSPGALNAMTRNEQDAYFRRALDWLEERHGKENVLSAVIHRDEATPHMTVMTIPLDDQGKLNARALVGNRTKLSAMQTDFAEQVGQAHGLERGVEGSKARHERVRSAYAHLNDPEAAVALPERRQGSFLGRGKETDAEWHRRATEAATGALAGAWSAMRREQKAHAVKTLSLENQLAGTPTTQHRLAMLEGQNRALQRQLDAVNAEADDLDRQLDRMEIARDTALTFAIALAQRQGIDKAALVEKIDASISSTIREEEAATEAAKQRPVPKTAQPAQTPATGARADAAKVKAPPEAVEGMADTHRQRRAEEDGDDWGIG